MKLVDLITTSQCQHIYQRYFKIIANPKPPHQITSKQIYQEIVNYYNADYHNILNILCLEEINFLDQLSARRHCRNDIATINTLINKCLLIKNPDHHNNLEIPDDIKTSVDLALQLVDKQEIAHKDKINELLIGILATRGIIDSSELISIYLKYDSSLSFQQLNEHLNNDHYLFQYYFIYQGDEQLLLAYEPYHSIVKQIEHLQTSVSKVELNYTASQLRLIARYGFDISQPQIAELYDAIEAIDSIFFRELLRNCILLYCQVHTDIDELIRIVRQLDIAETSVLTNIEDSLKTAAPLIHSAAFYGLAPYDYYLIMNVHSYFSEQECTTFYHLYLSILQYTNQLFNISKYPIQDIDYINQYEYLQIRTLLFNNPQIIDQYTKENPDHLTSYELNIITQFKNGFIDDFLILENHDDYTIVSNKNNIYAVYGLVNHLKEIYPDASLPQVCNLAILPYKHKIVFDGLLQDSSLLEDQKQLRHYQSEDIIYELPNNLLN